LNAIDFAGTADIEAMADLLHELFTLESDFKPQRAKQLAVSLGYIGLTGHHHVRLSWLKADRPFDSDPAFNQGVLAQGRPEQTKCVKGRNPKQARN